MKIVLSSRITSRYIELIGFACIWINNIGEFNSIGELYVTSGNREVLMGIFPHVLRSVNLARTGNGVFPVIGQIWSDAIRISSPGLEVHQRPSELLYNEQI